MGDHTHVNADHARSKDQGDELKRIAEGDFCPFCSEEYMTKNHPHPIEISGKHWFATMNRWPYENASAHFVIIHRRHISALSEVTDEEWQELRDITLQLEKAHDIKGGTLIMRYGDSRFTGASVTHLHAQLVSGSGNKEKMVLARVG